MIQSKYEQEYHDHNNDYLKNCAMHDQLSRKCCDLEAYLEIMRADIEGTSSSMLCDAYVNTARSIAELKNLSNKMEKQSNISYKKQSAAYLAMTQLVEVPFACASKCTDVIEPTDMNLTRHEKNAIKTNMELAKNVTMIVIAATRHTKASCIKFETAGDECNAEHCSIMAELNSLSAAKINKLCSKAQKQEHINSSLVIAMFSRYVYDCAMTHRGYDTHKKITKQAKVDVLKIMRGIEDTDTEYKTIDCKNYVGMFADLPGAQELHMKKFLETYTFDGKPTDKVVIIFKNKACIIEIREITSSLNNACDNLDEVARVRFVVI